MAQGHANVATSFDEPHSKGTGWTADPQQHGRGEAGHAVALSLRIIACVAAQPPRYLL